MHYLIGARNTSDTINTLLLKWHSSLEDLACCWRSELFQVVSLAEASCTYSSVDVLRRTQYRTPVGSLENAVHCCVLFTKPYHSNDGAVLFGVCVAVGKLLHSNEHLQISTVAIGYRCSQCVGGFHGRLPYNLPPRGNWCLGGEAYGKTDIASGVCSLGRWSRWWYFRRCFGWGCGDRRLESSGSTVVLVEYVSRHGDGFAAHKEF
jgi:hypothetical protein